MKKYIIVLLLILVLGLSWWLYRRESGPPQVPFTRVKRETLVGTLVTNGKVEPLEWIAVHSARAGPVVRVPIRQGETVKRGALLAQLDARDAEADLASAEARVEEARAQLKVLEQGGRSVEVAQIESDLARAGMDLEVAQKDHAALERLAGKDAATRQQVNEAAERIDQVRLQIEALRKKRASLVSQADKTTARARLEEAETAAKLARRNIQEASIRAPIGGVVYELGVRPGAYLNPGDLVAKVGQTEKVRVRLYVDEPELGRVSKGVPVTITWDAFQHKQWKGVVEHMPTEIVPLGARQVGEVICVIDNEGRELLPGTNVNAEIRSAVVENALTIPREALRRQDGQDGAFVLNASRIAWRAIRIGKSSTTRTQVVEGLSEGDSVALPTEQPLVDGMEVKPVYPG